MDAIERQYLHAMFCLSRAGNHITMGSLATAARLRAEQVAMATIRLGKAGLIDSDRLRLTMRGLAVAATLADLGAEEREAAVHTMTLGWVRLAPRPAAS